MNICEPLEVLLILSQIIERFPTNEVVRLILFDTGATRKVRGGQP